ncbi:MAG TPA: hypothetical protein VEE86_02075 [Thermoplasmata archaeon]|nr:hypothetical protein [Thermoplasmata archaeon]
MLTAADLEVNVLDFRHRSFQFDRRVDLGGTAYAVFSRTETESERQLRPKLVRLSVVVPLAWVVLDPASDSLRVARDGTVGRSTDAAAVEVAAEPPEFEEDGIRWKRAPAGTAGYVYAPLGEASIVLGRDGLTALGLG